jgi:hypothetical protein
VIAMSNIFSILFLFSTTTKSGYCADHIVSLVSTTPFGSLSYQFFPIRLYVLPTSFPGRLLARVLKEGVQFWYNDTSTVRGGGGGGGGVRENVPLENLWCLRYFMSVSVPSSFESFQTHLALWVCAAMLFS